jgi:hypothetical protein
VVTAASLRPPGLPPSALLCVRRLRDPLPGELRLDTGALRPSVEWERAAADALARTAAAAARPARGPVPPGAEAVLFADRAELLASLARDWLGGDLGGRWWWPLLLHVRLPAGDAVAAAWLAAPEEVPAALELLAASRHAVAFVSLLPAAAAVELVEAVAAAHAVPLPRGRRAVAAEALPRPLRSFASPRRGAAAIAAPVPRSAPWRGVVPEADEPSLAPAAVALLGLALCLARSPGRARTPSFAAAVARRLEPGAPVEAAPVARGAQAVRAAPELPIHSAEPVTKAATTRPAHRASRAPGAPPAVPSPREATGVPGARSRRAGSPSADAPVPAAPTAASRRAEPQTAPRRPPAAAVTPPTPSTPSPAAEPEPLLAGTRTELGGLFYLLNLALALGLYGDFTRPLDRPLRLDPWDLVALLGRELLRGEHAGDPVWALLARLAGRGPDEPPGARFRPPRDLRLPPDWVEPFGGDGTPWRFATTGGRLRVQHPAQFTVLDLPLGRNASVHLARALRRYGSPPSAPGLFLYEPDAPALERWARRLGAYVRTRLRLAGVETSALVQPARVFVTATHVDVVAELEHLAVEVRVAGLDRDPGWIPAAGRDVRFHFE